MPKIGRNDPCPCGSGKKYKNCHLPIEEAAQATQRRTRQTVDTLMPKLIEAAQGMPEAITPALERYWNGKYSADQLVELDDLEDRGADRFLTWFVFDYQLEDGRTLAEKLAAGEGTLDLSDDEMQLLQQWTLTRLRPYGVESVLKGQTFQVHDLLDEATYAVEDHAASRRVETGDVLVAHLVPGGERFYIAGSVAHLTADTREKLQEYAALHLEAFSREHPNATWSDLLRERSETLDHFVMQLPIEEPNPTLLDNIILQTRASLMLAGDSIGIGKQGQAASDDAEVVKDES